MSIVLLVGIKEHTGDATRSRLTWTFHSFKAGAASRLGQIMDRIDFRIEQQSSFETQSDPPEETSAAAPAVADQGAAPPREPAKKRRAVAPRGARAATDLERAIICS